jgi:hypothetical protein
MAHSNAPAEIYQLHILLLQINPPIWRRLHVRSDSSIATLHELLAAINVLAKAVIILFFARRLAS